MALWVATGDEDGILWGGRPRLRGTSWSRFGVPVNSRAGRPGADQEVRPTERLQRNVPWPVRAANTDESPAL